MTIHKEGYPTLILSFLVLSSINFLAWQFLPFVLPVLICICVILFLFLVSFFRKPDRSISQANDEIILSPCDGKVVVIEKVYEPEFIKDECMQVSIFMSPLNVHINWYPTSGHILYSKYHPGKFLAAWNPKASTENERTTVCYQIGEKKILLRQVAGALARRIVCYAKQGDSTSQGEEMGFIKFGSRVDLYLPIDTKLSVSIGTKVIGNRTKIGEM